MYFVCAIWRMRMRSVKSLVSTAASINALLDWNFEGGMKTILASVSFIALSVSASSAADLAPSYAKAPMLQAAAYNWTGFYAGLNAGYAFGRETSTASAGGGIFSISNSSAYDGFLGGGQLGYNAQFGSLVVGVEGDIQYADVGGKFSVLVPGVGGNFETNKLNAFGTVRGRVGFAFDRVLVYGTGGFAAGRNTFTLSDAVGTSVDDSATHTGWAAGAGLEYGIRENWSVKAEYLHVDLGSKDYFSGIGLVVFQSRMKFDIARAGVNYRF